MRSGAIAPRRAAAAIGLFAVGCIADFPVGMTADSEADSTGDGGAASMSATAMTADGDGSGTTMGVEPTSGTSAEPTTDGSSATETSMTTSVEDTGVTTMPQDTCEMFAEAEPCFAAFGGQECAWLGSPDMGVCSEHPCGPIFVCPDLEQGPCDMDDNCVWNDGEMVCDGIFACPNCEELETELACNATGDDCQWFGNVCLYPEPL